MSGLVSTPKYRPVVVAAPVEPVIEKIEPAAKEAAVRESERIKKRKGAQSTILTGQAGLTTTPTTLKEKLGE